LVILDEGDHHPSDADIEWQLQAAIGLAQSCLAVMGICSAVLTPPERRRSFLLSRGVVEHGADRLAAVDASGGLSVV
jgi:hypothetical protein